ncbi:MAG TPA: DEAD/DEAH box helicase [Candidatus Baltobacteraceae bacterium]|jgi:ATP-dependent Lhr-like helicase|nr:DEAD/DEAH box helicase [Candidatus Baltobacteraceae bacterium]
MDERSPQIFSGVLHPAVARWCELHLQRPTPPQIEGVPAGAARENVLICSPTGTGKTLAAFLPVMSRLAQRRDEDRLFPKTFALYVSPLRALGYDVEHNIRTPLREMDLLERPNSPRAQLRRGRLREAFVRTGVRTGDTPPEERRLLISRPPHLLITTPESLAVMIAMDSYRRALRTVETVIVDEVHALAGNKRGAQLSLLLETLEELVEMPFNRVGLSATIEPLEAIARFVAGTSRPCRIVDNRGLRSIDVDVVAPFSGALASLPLVARTASELSGKERTTLVFTNVRSQAERIALEMRQLAQDPSEVERVDREPREREYDARIGVHHSALERSVRHRVEAGLRSGSLRTVVCSSSLELGVDIGSVDRVLLVGGARGMTAALQRIGRAGHRPGAVARGTVIAQDRDDIIEAAATIRCIAEGVLEPAAIPQSPLDVLAQWLVGTVCPDRRIDVDEALRVARRAFPYASLSRDELIRCAKYLSGGGAGGEEAHARRLGFDGNAIYGLGREACAAYFENAGTLPGEQGVTVRLHGGAAIGRVEESFCSGLQQGDVFVLGGRTLRVKELTASAVTVEAFAGRPTVPQWSSHLKGIPVPLADEIHCLRTGIARRLRDRDALGARAWLRERYRLDGTLAAHVVRYIAQQMAVSAVPTPTRPLVEIYVMDRRQTAVFHTGSGRRINEAIARAAGARVYAQTGANTNLTTDDEGFMLALPRGKRLADAQWASLLARAGFERDLWQGLRSSHLLRTHFRHVANTGLLVLRRAGGRTIRRGALAWNSRKIFERIYAADRSFPLIRETLRTITRDLLDLPGAIAYLENLDGEPRVLHPPAASPFTFGILASSFADSVVLDERTDMVEALHRRVLEIAGEELGE